jgi:hypothetical protein
MQCRTVGILPDKAPKGTGRYHDFIEATGPSGPISHEVNFFVDKVEWLDTSSRPRLRCTQLVWYWQTKVAKVDKRSRAMCIASKLQGPNRCCEEQNRKMTNTLCNNTPLETADPLGGKPRGSQQTVLTRSAPIQFLQRSESVLDHLAGPVRPFSSLGS